MTKAIVSVACKARDLTDTLSESIRADIHAKLEELIQSSQRCPYVLTQAGLEASRRYDRQTLELIK